MPVITCPKCNARAQVPDDAAGKAVQCPQCRERYPVPTSNGPLAPVTITAAPVAQPAQPEPRIVRCPFCDYRGPATRHSRPSTGAYIVFALLVFLGPLALLPIRDPTVRIFLMVLDVLLCWLPLGMIREIYHRCAACHIRLG